MLNVMLLAGCVWCAVRFCQARIGTWAGAILGVAFVVASVVPVFGVFLTSEIFNFRSCSSRTSCGCTSSSVRNHTGSRLPKSLKHSGMIFSPWTDLLAAILIGVATYSKPGVLIAPLAFAGLFMWSRKHWAAVMAAFLLTTGGSSSPTRSSRASGTTRAAIASRSMTRTRSKTRQDVRVAGRGHVDQRRRHGHGARARNHASAADQRVVLPGRPRRRPRPVLFPRHRDRHALAAAHSTIDALAVGDRGGHGRIDSRPVGLFPIHLERRGRAAGQSLLPRGLSDDALPAAIGGGARIGRGGARGGRGLHRRDGDSPFAAASDTWRNITRPPLRYLPVELTILDDLPVRLNPQRGRILSSTTRRSSRTSWTATPTTRKGRGSG